MGTRRIALVCSSYHPHTGGVEEHTRQVAHELAGRGHEVQVWTVDRGEHLGRRVVDGVLVHYLPCPQPARTPRAVLRFLAEFPLAARRWQRAYRQLRPDVLHVQCFGPNGLYAFGLHRTTGVPLVVSSHGETFADDHNVFEQSRLMAWSLRRSILVAGAVTGCSQFVVDDLHRRFGASRAIVVPNGVGPRPPSGSDRLEVGRRNGHQAKAPIVAAVGRMEVTKGFDLLLEAFAVARLPAGSHLIVGGEGPTRSLLRTRAGELGLDDRVHLPGRLDPPGVAEMMDHATVVVVPSRHEAFGITVLEAWRAGRPVIATTLGGPPEFVRDGTDGLLVDPRDTAALAAALEQVMGDPDRATRMGRAGLARVADFGWPRVADGYERIYRELLDR